MFGLQVLLVWLQRSLCALQASFQTPFHLQQFGIALNKEVILSAQFQKAAAKRGYSNIDGIDYQILVEADFLVNFYEDNLAKDAIDTALQKIFRTEAGKTLCRLCYIND